MLKALIKKELLQLNQYYFYNSKTKKLKTKGGIIRTVILFALLFIILGFSLGAWAFLLADSFIPAGFDWLYFSMMGLIALILGVFGDAFNTYAVLYKSKDNDLLLSMPITPSVLLFSRMTGVIVMGLLYESIVFIPTCIVYWIVKEVTLKVIIYPLIIWLCIAVLVTVLTCFLGWIISLISSKITNKGITRALATLVFLALYYVVYFKMINSLNDVAAHIQEYADFISGWFFFAYHLGLGAGGSTASLLLTVGICAAFFAVVYIVMTKSYVKMVTSNKGEKKVVYHRKEEKSSPVMWALIKKEAKHYSSVSVYLLNTGIGLIIMVAGAVLVLVKHDFVQEIVGSLSAFAEVVPWISKVVYVMPSLLCMMIIGMNGVSASSVSLEGSNLWILQSSPVEPRQVLSSKFLFHLLVCTFPTVLLPLVLSAVMKLGFAGVFFNTLLCFVYMVFCDIAGVVLDTVKANFSWTSEAIPVKQGFSFTVEILGGYGITIICAGIFFLMRNFVNPILFLAVLCVVFAMGTSVLYRCMIKGVSERFRYS